MITRRRCFTAYSCAAALRIGCSHLSRGNFGICPPVVAVSTAADAATAASTPVAAQLSAAVGHQ